MTTPPAGPGKTAPKIYQDFVDFDPQNVRGGANILTDLPPPVGEGQQPSQLPSACRHEYTTKHDQSVTPPLDLRPEDRTQYKLCVACKKCRLHAVIRLDYSRSTNPCPNSHYPLHHFQHLPAQNVASQTQLGYAWQCSAPQCLAHLRISFRLPRLSAEDRDLLTNTELLKRRYEAVVEQDPNREGIRQATPLETLSRLRKYIKDSLNPEHNRRSFPANNKRFMEAFGVHGLDCSNLLHRLGFQYAEDISEWSLPNPAVIDDPIETDGDTLRELLGDVELELVALMYKVAADTGAMNPAATESWPSAARDLERVLAAQGYQRYVTSLRRTGPANDMIPYFSSLGALPDFADGLVEYAYDRQSECDRGLQAYYFECLQMIAESRGSEQLNTKSVLLQSMDYVSRRDLAAAYRGLGIAPHEQATATDEAILNIFQARQPNVSAVAAEENRQALRCIGVARGSALLINASNQRLETYEDALAWIGNGVSRTTDDETLVNYLALKDDKETAREAISIIARERKSNMLNQWLLTGRTDGYTMSVDEALRYLAIEQKIEEIDRDALEAALKIARNERPGEQTEKAITTIEQALAGRTAPVQYAPGEWPVGLRSHGNTCYLNSLLQYYFAIKNLRDIVLGYEQYKLDLSVEKEKTARVGGRQISMVEIKGGQRFAADLKDLFEAMIADPSSMVTPDRDMVCRAFLEPQAYHMLLSSGMDEPTVPRSKEPNPPLPAVAEESGADADLKIENGTDEEEKDSRQDSVASSATLQADDLEDTPMQLGTEKPLPSSMNDGSTTNAPQPPQPSQAPPLPPRRFSTTEDIHKAQKEALAIAEQKASQQQDVTEVHDSITFRLRSGMKPEGTDDTGEQLDAIRALYTITLTQTALHGEQPTGKPQVLFDSSIQLNVPKEDTDIYEALDEIFDAQTYEGSNLETFKSIRSLPPILQISIPRIGWDKHRGTYKSEKTVRLEDELYLDRYCDFTDPSVLPARQRCWAWRKQLRELRKEQSLLKYSAPELHMQALDTVTETAAYLRDIAQIDNDILSDPTEDLDPSALSDSLISIARAQTSRLQDIETQIASLRSQLSAQFRSLAAVKYRLAAVFFHRGQAGGGHYWIHIKDFSQDIWRHYNDETVQQATPTQVEATYRAKSWNDGTPTYAVYVREEEKEEVVQPVCRKIEEKPLPALPEDEGVWVGDEVRPQMEMQTIEEGMEVDEQTQTQTQMDQLPKAQAMGDWASEEEKRMKGELPSVKW